MKLLPIDISQLSQAATGDYTNLPLSVVNDQVIRLSVMTRPYYWHYHPNSDESFLGLEGILIIELENQTVELHPGQLITIPKGIPHKTRPKNQRSVNLTFEHQHMETSIIRNEQRSRK